MPHYNKCATQDYTRVHQLSQPDTSRHPYPFWLKSSRHQLSRPPAIATQLFWLAMYRSPVGQFCPGFAQASEGVVLTPQKKQYPPVPQFSPSSNNNNNSHKNDYMFFSACAYIGTFQCKHAIFCKKNILPGKRCPPGGVLLWKMDAATIRPNSSMWRGGADKTPRELTSQLSEPLQQVLWGCHTHHPYHRVLFSTCTDLRLTFFNIHGRRQV